MDVDLMLDPAPWVSFVRDLDIAVHNGIPSDWPSVASPGEAVFHVFQSREFLEVWQATRGRQKGVSTYFVEVKTRCGKRVMLLPLAITRDKGVRVLGFADGKVSDFNAPVLYPEAGASWSEEAVRALWERVLDLLPPVDLVRLEKMPQQVHGICNPMAALGDRDNPEGAHGTDLTPDWDVIESRQNFLRTLKKNRRALEKLGPVELVVAETPDEVQALLKVALAQKQARTADTKVKGFEADPVLLDYYREATRVFHAGGKLHLAALKVGDDIVATSWSLVHGTRVYCILIGFAFGVYRKYSCGRILHFTLLGWLKDRGYTYFDQGFGDEGWKLNACDTHETLRQLVVPVTLRGRGLVAYGKAREALRQNPHWQRLRQALFRPAAVDVTTAGASEN